MNSFAVIENARLRREKVKALYDTKTNAEIAAILGVKKGVVAADAVRLGIKKSLLHRSKQAQKHKTASSQWTPPLKEILDLMYPVMSNADLSELLGFSEVAIGQAGKRRGLKKTVNTRTGRSYNSIEKQKLLAKARKAKKTKALKKAQAHAKAKAAAKAAAKVVQAEDARKAAEARAAAKAIQAARREKNLTHSDKPQGPRLPSPMSEAMRKRMEKERFVYAPDALPWRAQRMLGTTLAASDLSYGLRTSL